VDAPGDVDAAAAEDEAEAEAEAEAGPADDLATALPVMKWNVGEFLPPAIRQYFETSVALFVWEPWHEAALKAAAEGRAAPSLDEVTAASETFFEGLFSTKVLEYVDEIRRNLSSCGVADQLAVTEGRATAEQAAVAFPVLPGSHLVMGSPALEFVKLVCHLVALDAPLQPAMLRLRRNLLRLLDVREFADEAQFVNPCRTYVLPDVMCGFCGACRDLDLCRDRSAAASVVAGAHWSCEQCAHPYDHEALESRLVQIVQRRSHAYQLQDLQCVSCRQVKTDSLSSICPKCAGAFSTRQPAAGLREALAIFRNVAQHHDMPWLLETVERLA
jgi:DNA polymerase epsilon subunit 1